MSEQPTEVRDLETLVGLVDQDRISVDWTVNCEIGPEWMGSNRALTFYVDGNPIAENPLTQRLANALVDALSIPATSKDHVISGEGDLRRRGTVIEIVYDWNSTIPYDWSSGTCGGVVEIIDISDN